mgnify:CR=1 FL=1
MNKEKADMIIYTTEDGLTKVETTFDGDTVWLSIDQMAELFQRDRSVIGKHVRNIFKEGELEKESVWAKFAHTAADGKVYDVAVDLRLGSATFGKYYGVVLDCEKQNMFYIPEGFAHGFYVISDSAVFAYKCTDFYHPEDEAGLMWNDKSINVDWHSVCGDVEPLLSEKDTKHPAFDFSKKYFDMSANWIGEN